jgi:hypothetical protein
MDSSENLEIWEGAALARARRLGHDIYEFKPSRMMGADYREAVCPRCGCSIHYQTGVSEPGTTLRGTAFKMPCH